MSPGGSRLGSRDKRERGVRLRPGASGRQPGSRAQFRRGGRVAEGAALEMPCRGNSTVGSNPTPSAIYPQHGKAMLTVGEKVTSLVLAH